MIRKILIYTYGDQSHDNAIEAAAIFAAQHDAELTGLFVRPDMMGYATIYGSYPLNLAQSFYDQQSEFAAKLKSSFEKIVAKHDVRNQWHEIEQFERRPKPSLYADYIFVSQPDKESSVLFNDADFVDHLITDTGLPTVVIPKGWSANSFGEKPALGWVETREAVSAVRHTLSLMRKADNVDIVTVSKKPDLDEELLEGIEISEYLTEHGVITKFYAEHINEEDRNEADTILRHVNNHARDLIIVGGYGHSRFREIILGGVTRALIQKSPVPVILSH